MKISRIIICVAACLAVLTSCRKEDVIEKPTVTPVEPSGPADDPSRAVVGFYLLNEGNMGSNKATLDFYDAASGTYIRNIYGAANPSVAKELGDVGNDLAIYGSRLYALINCSNKIEIMDAATCRRIGQVNIPNCRFMAFDGPYLYVTSYAGPVVIDPDYKQLGYVAKVDTATMEVVATATVGFQPDGIAVSGRRLYVANSGGYMAPHYERTMSVIDIPEFRVVDTVDIGLNLGLVLADNCGQIWVASRGNLYDIGPRLYCYDIAAREIVADLEISVGDMWLDDDLIYIVGNEWSNVTMKNTVSYAVVDVRSHKKVADSFITDGTETRISKPYGVAVDPVSKDIYVTDGRNYVNPGDIYCFAPDGTLRWTTPTGDIPAHIAFLRK